MKNIKNSAVAEKSLAAHRLLKIKSTEDKSYQISAENCLRKRDWYGLVHFSQRKRCGNAAETRNATSFCSYVFPPSGNVTETWTIRFPQDFRNTETPYFTLCVERFRNSNPAFEPMNMLFFTEMLAMLLLTVNPLWFFRSQNWFGLLVMSAFWLVNVTESRMQSVSFTVTSMQFPSSCDALTSKEVFFTRSVVLMRGP